MSSGFLLTLVLAHWHLSFAAVHRENRRADYLQRALPEAREAADVVFLGQVENIRPSWPVLRVLGVTTDDHVTLRVLEVFKGQVSGSVSVDCYPVLLAGEPRTGTALVYARAGRFGTLHAGHDSRTRFVREGDRELSWLRTGLLPPAPVALRREITPGVWGELEELIAVIDCHWGGPFDAVSCALTNGLIPFEGEVPPGPIFVCGLQETESAAPSRGRAWASRVCSTEPR